MTTPEKLRPLRIAIVGGGPGGLATSIALRKVPNVEVTIYEQASELREVGAGISIGQNTWNVLELLGVADSLTSGHPTTTVLNLNGQTGEEPHRIDRLAASQWRTSIRIQRTELQSALLEHVPKHCIQLGRRISQAEDLGQSGVRLVFTDGSTTIADLVVGADGIRSVDLDPRFATTAWWHGPTTHVYFSPVGEGLWEIAARAWQDPAVHSASKVSWGTLVDNKLVEAHFTAYLPQIQTALKKVPKGAWREFAAFAGPELATLTAWDNKIVLVGDSSHALSGAFGSGAGFAMEDGWVLLQALKASANDLEKALRMFDDIRLPYYSRMYSHLDSEAARRALKLSRSPTATDEERVRHKVIRADGEEMQWIYGNNIGQVWAQKAIAVA